MSPAAMYSLATLTVRSYSAGVTFEDGHTVSGPGWMSGGECASGGARGPAVGRGGVWPTHDCPEAFSCPREGGLGGDAGFRAHRRDHSDHVFYGIEHHH